MKRKRANGHLPAEFTSDKFRRLRVAHRIRNLDAPRWVKRVLLAAKDVTKRIGGTVIRVGKKLVEIVLTFVDRYPTTSVTVIFLAAVTWLVANVPVLGVVLGPIVTAISCLLALFVFAQETALNARLQSAFSFMASNR